MSGIGAFFFAIFAIAIGEPGLPFWMMEKMNATPIEIGLPLFATGFGYLLGIILFSNYGHHFGRFPV